MKLLLSRKANLLLVSAKSDGSQTAEEAARDEDHDDIADLLRAE